MRGLWKTSWSGRQSHRQCSRDDGQWRQGFLLNAHDGEGSGHWCDHEYLREILCVPEMYGKPSNPLFSAGFPDSLPVSKEYFAIQRYSVWYQKEYGPLKKGFLCLLYKDRYVPVCAPVYGYSEGWYHQLLADHCRWLWRQEKGDAVSKVLPDCPFSVFRFLP